jgi:hypothetical protein
MPGKYKRLILGLLVFLGLMLLVGRFQVDTTRAPAMPSDQQLQVARQEAHQARLAEKQRNPYRLARDGHPPCSGEAVAADLRRLRQQREQVVHGISFADARDPYSLQPLLELSETLSREKPADCLQKASSELQQAIYSARGILVAHSESYDDSNVFELRAEMMQRMEHSLATADQQFVMVEEAMKEAGQAGASAPTGTPPP